MPDNMKNMQEVRKPAHMTNDQWMQYLRTARAADHVANGYVVNSQFKCCDDKNACSEHDPDAIAFRALQAKAVSKTSLTQQDVIDKTTYELRMREKGLI